ncbi:MAG: hypothetical protein ACFCUI_07725 [Bernardetiaceae bacterium]
MDALVQILPVVLVILFFLFRQARRARPSQIPEELQPPVLSEPKPAKPRPTSTFEQLLKQLRGETQAEKDLQEQLAFQERLQQQKQKKSQLRVEDEVAQLKAQVQELQNRQAKHEKELAKINQRPTSWKAKLQNTASARDAIVIAEILKTKF